MKKSLKIFIECGETNCRSKDYVCEYLRWHVAVEHIAHCTLFGKLETKDGWIQRHQLCLKCEDSNE
jgi:hypothetical protein